MLFAIVIILAALFVTTRTESVEERGMRMMQQGWIVTKYFGLFILIGLAVAALFL